MKLNAAQIEKIRRTWDTNPAFLGFADAERDAADAQEWLEHLLVRPNWFKPAVEQAATLVVGRKGVGKSASRIVAANQYESSGRTVVVQASADELVARHASRLQAAADRGFGAVSDWCHVYAELLVRNIATQLGGNLITGDDEAAIRQWAVIEGISERDFGERVASAIKSLVPWAQKLASERSGLANDSDERFRRVAMATTYALYIDDFDNIQENPSLATTRLVRDAIEAADRITHQNRGASIHLLMRQDLWLRIRPGWHYADKVAGVVELNWTQDDLRKWADRRLRHAAAVALGISPERLPNFEFGELWATFFPDQITLRNEKESSGLHYMVRRTMYTPRSLRQFMLLVVQRSRKFPATLRDVEDAEQEFAVSQLEFLKTEFGGLCEGLGICLQSFTGKMHEMIPSDLYKHLGGLMGTGQVRLVPGASDADDPAGLARFLFRIGFLEVRYQQEGRFEVRDAMRQPDHWKSIRQDDAVRWAVRSAFYSALRAHR